MLKEAPGAVGALPGVTCRRVACGRPPAQHLLQFPLCPLDVDVSEVRTVLAIQVPAAEGSASRRRGGPVCGAVKILGTVAGACVLLVVFRDVIRGDIRG